MKGPKHKGDPATAGAAAPAAQDDMAGGILLPPGVAVRDESAEPVVEAEAVVVAQAPELPWTLSTWSGLPQWRCMLCPWDTLDGEDAMIEHIEARHAGAPAVAPLVQAYDRWGNPI